MSLPLNVLDVVTFLALAFGASLLIEGLLKGRTL